MALFYPDILEHNNPAKPLLNDDQLWGGIQVVDDKTARNSIGENKRKIGSTVSWSELSVITIQKYVGPDTTDPQWTNDLNWENVMSPFKEENIVKVLLANDTTVLPIGDKTLYISFVIRYQMTRDAVIAMGTIEVMHNGSSLETPVAFDIREFNGSIGLVDITSAFNSDEVELSFEIDNSSASDVIMVYDIQRKTKIHVPEWALQTSPVANGELLGVYFIDVNNGWAVGSNSDTSQHLILNTTDGGANWTQQSSPIVDGGTLRSVIFVDANNGWIVGEGGTSNVIILNTIDGGANWVQQTSPVTLGTLYGVSFVDTLHGWAVGYDGSNHALILATIDGGTTWGTQTSPSIDYLYYGVFFIDANHGWAVGDNAGVGQIVSTVDGGVTWGNQTSPGTLGQILSIHFVDINNGWAVGNDISGNAIFHTTNGGALWTQQTSPIFGASLLSVNFVDENVGWCVGDDGSTAIAIFNTVDGGTNWTEQTSAAADIVLEGVSFVDSSHGWAVGITSLGAIVIENYS